MMSQVVWLQTSTILVLEQNHSGHLKRVETCQTFYKIPGVPGTGSVNSSGPGSGWKRFFKEKYKEIKGKKSSTVTMCVDNGAQTQSKMRDSELDIQRQLNTGKQEGWIGETEIERKKVTKEQQPRS